MPDNVIEIVIRAVDAATASIGLVTAKLAEQADALVKAGGAQAKYGEYLKTAEGVQVAFKAAMEGVNAATKSHTDEQTKATKAQQESTEATKKHGDALTGMGAAIVVVNQGLELAEKVFGGFVDFLKEASQDAGRFEQTMVGLTGTFEVFGKSANAEKIIEFSDEMRKTQNVTRELALSVSADLATFTDLGAASDATGEKLKKLTQITIALAKVTGRSPEFQSLQIANFLSNPATSSFGRGLNAPAGLTLDEKQNFLIKEYGGLIEIAGKQQDTFIGQQERLKLAIEGVGHVLGGEANQSLKGWYRLLADVFQATESWLEQHEGVAAGLTKIGLAAGSAITVLTALAAIKFAASIAAVAEFGAAFLALATGPIGITLAAIGAVVALVYKLKSIGEAESAESKIAQIQQVIDRLEKAKSGQTQPQAVARTQAAIDAQTALLNKLRESETTSHEAAPAAAEGINRKQEELFASALKKSQEFALGAAAAMSKAQGDVAANAQRLIFEETGSLDAMLNSFAIRAETARKVTGEKIAATTARIAKEVGIKPGEVAAKLPGALALEAGPVQMEGALEQQRIDAERQKFLFDYAQKQIQVTEASQKALLAVDEQLLANDKERLKILGETGAPLGEQLALVTKNSEVEKDLIERRKLNLQRTLDQYDEQLKKLDANSQKAQELQTKEAEIRKEIEQQNALLLKLPYDIIKEQEDAIARSAKNVTQEYAAQVTFLEALKGIQERRLALIDTQAQLEGKAHAPLAERLAIAQEIDRLTKEELAAKIKSAEVELQTAQTRLGATPGSSTEQAAVDMAKAHLDAIEMEAQFAKDKVSELNVQLIQESQAAAQSISQEFADQFIQGITGALNGAKGSFSKFVDDALISIGKSLVTGFLKEGVQKLVEPQLKEIQASGEKAPTSLSGLLGLSLKGIFGSVFGGKKAEAAMPEGIFGSFPGRSAIPANINRGFEFSLPEAGKTYEPFLGNVGSKTSSGFSMAEAGTSLKNAGTLLIEAARKLLQVGGAPGAGGTGPTGVSQVEATQENTDALMKVLDQMENGISVSPAEGATVTPAESAGGVSSLSFPGFGGESGSGGASLGGIAGLLSSFGIGGGGGILSKLLGGAGALGGLGKSLSGLFGGGQGIFGGGGGWQLALPQGAELASAAGDIVPDVAGGGGGFWDWLTGSHEGGIIRSMHSGGLAADERLIKAQSGEYMLRKSAVGSIGKGVLDMINSTGTLPSFHGGGGVSPGARGFSMSNRALSAMGGEGGGDPGWNSGSVDSGARPEPIHQNIYIVDQRPGRLGPNDVVQIVRNDMEKGGLTGKGVQNVLKRSRNG
jgi:hypothetical protein